MKRLIQLDKEEKYNIQSAVWWTLKKEKKE